MDSLYNNDSNGKAQVECPETAKEGQDKVGHDVQVSLLQCAEFSDRQDVCVT